MINDVVDVEQIAAGILPVAFLALYLYSVRPVRRSAESWWLIGTNSVFGLVLLLGVATLIFGQSWPQRDWVRAVIYALVDGVFVAQLGLLLRALDQPDPKAELKE